jgi:hypothetical protein
MPDDEDSIWSWLLAIALGTLLAVALMAWPLVAWRIVWSVFK